MDMEYTKQRPEAQRSGKQEAWCQTFSGKKLSLTNPRPEDVCIADIAHALSNLCRFGGACREFYSVAQHSVLVCDLVTDLELKMPALLHDAAEGLGLGDVVNTLKNLLPNYRSLEDGMATCVAQVFGFHWYKFRHPVVYWADLVALSTERRDLMVPCDWQWDLDKSGVSPVSTRVVPLPPKEAEELFLARFKQVRDVDIANEFAPGEFENTKVAGKYGLMSYAELERFFCRALDTLNELSFESDSRESRARAAKALSQFMEDGVVMERQP